ncbi:VC0807 family protein [uncultured Jatrophihabitans sp.]|uniref:VC0807 family protein n=1 Tax=uncultured Jatrophihabitans sp. TaxID=1610747 RepID=UPI0035CAB008
MVELLDVDVRPARTLTATPYLGEAPQRPPAGWRTTLRPLAVDLALPFGAYYVSRDVLGTTMITAFAVSGAVSLGTLLVSLRRERRVSALSALVLAVNVAGLALTFVGGDVRLVAAKDAVISSVVGFGILVSVWRGRPALAEALRPFITHGRPPLDDAWDRLTTASPRFRRLVASHSLVLGGAFVADCVVRVLCAAYAPLGVLGWIGTAATVGALVLGAVGWGAVFGDRLARMVIAESGADCADAPGPG